MDLDELSPDGGRQELEEEGPDHRPERRAHAADQHHDVAVDRHADVEGAARLDEVDPVAPDAANEAGHAGADGPGQGLGERGVDAHDLRAHLAVAQRPQRVAERRAREPHHQQYGGDHRAQHQVIDQPVELFRRQRAQRQRQSLGAARHAAHVDDEISHRHVERDRGNREIVPLETQQRPADDRRAQHRHDRRQYESNRHGHAERDRDAHDVGPHAEEHRVAEGVIAGKPDDHVEPLGHHRVHVNAGKNAHPVTAEQERRRQHERDHQHKRRHREALRQFEPAACGGQDRLLGHAHATSP